MAERFVCDGGQLVPAGQASLSQPLEEDGIVRLLCGYVQEDLCGVFAASRQPEGGLVTDVFALRNGAFTNITLQEGSAGTAREGEIFGMDIDDDGFVELPSVQYLQKLENQDTRTYYLVDWYNLDADGGKHTKLTTYYNVESGWYLKLPPAWRGKVLVHYGEDESGYTGYGFYLYAAAPEQTQWAATIYQFTGPDAQTVPMRMGAFCWQPRETWPLPRPCRTTWADRGGAWAAVLPSASALERRLGEIPAAFKKGGQP